MCPAPVSQAYEDGCDAAWQPVTPAMSMVALFTLGAACRYLASSADLQKFAACLHLLQDFPHAILIDDICSFTEDRYMTSQALQRCLAHESLWHDLHHHLLMSDHLCSCLWTGAMHSRTGGQRREIL